MTMTLKDAKQGLQIDKNSLDDALIMQPEFFYRVANELTLAISNRDALKLDLQNAVAALDQQFRQEAAKAGEKITEKAIEQEINTTPRIGDLRKQMNDAQFAVDQWAAMKEAWQQRSYVLKDLAGLFAANYFTVSTGARPRAQAQDAVADDNRARAGRQRRERLRPQCEAR